MNQTTGDLNTRQNYVTTGLASQAVSASALPEELTIFNRTIQTQNYVEGYSGWRITGDGNAEFGNVIVRGDINAYSGSIGYWNISTPAVSRVIGTRTLLGTFIESSSTGSTDSDVTSGTYVGLYKSYSPDDVVVTLASRATNVATITSVGHEFIVGDSVTVSIESDTTYNNGLSPSVITAITNDTFSYANIGTNSAEASVIGTVKLYNPDVAGLYLRDYGKTNFDYGYYSSAGAAYVSAETLNLIYNPSFEWGGTNTYTITAALGNSPTSATYTVNYVSTLNPFATGQKITVASMTPTYFNGTFFVASAAGSSGAWTVTVTGTGFTTGGTGSAFGNITSASKPTVASWDQSDATAVTSESFITSGVKDFATASSFGGSVSWYRTVPTNKFRGIVGYNVGDTYSLFSGLRTLHLNYDAFLKYIPFECAVTSMTIGSGDSTVTTTTAHGLVANDLVYLDFTAVASNGRDYATDFTHSSRYQYSKVFVVKTAPTASTFTIDNLTTVVPSTATLTPAARLNNDGSSRSIKLYKVIWPTIDLSEVSFVFPNGTSTALVNVLAVDTAASWSASAYYKYKSINPNYWMSEYLDTVDGIGPLTGNTIHIDGSKLASAYLTNDSANYLARTDIKIHIPIKTYSQATTNGYAGTYTSSTSTTLSSRSNVTAISGNGTTITYTGGNNFAAGDKVTVTGATTAGFNVTDATILSSPAPTATAFYVSGSATGSTSTATANAYKQVSTLIDEVSLSTEAVAFYGDTSSDYYWKDESLNSPSQVSVQAPKKWIDIDLDTQTGILSNLDYVGFKATNLSHPMSSKPSISTTIDDILVPNAFNIYDFEQLKLSSGIFNRPNKDDTGINSFEAYQRVVTGDTGSIFEAVATSYTANDSIATLISTYKSNYATIQSGLSDYTELYTDNFVPANSYFNVETAGSIDLTAGGLLGASIKIDSEDVNLSSSGTSSISLDGFLSTISITGTTTYIDGKADVSSTLDVTGVTTLYNNAYVPTSDVIVGASYVIFPGTVGDIGSRLSPSGYGMFARDNSTTAGALFVGKVNYTGTASTSLIDFRINAVQVGSVSASGTGGGTVAYNAFMGAHYTEFDGPVPLLGTVMDVAPGLVEHQYSGQERLPKTKISDTAGSKSVYGIYFSDYPNPDDDDAPTGHMVAALGASWIRIASGLTVVAGDLLESNGDGCARIQSDDLIRSSTVGKVTSTEIINTYEDGSYLVPCVLYCG